MVNTNDPPPYELDFFQTIKAVNWGSANLLAISYLFRSNLNPNQLAFPFSGFVFDSGSYDVLKLTTAPTPGAKAASVANPPSDAMLSNLYMFTVAPAYNFNYSTTDDDNLTVTDYARANTLVFNLGKIKSALGDSATSVTITATMPTTSGAYHGVPQSEAFVDQQFAATQAAAKAITLANLATLPEYLGIIDVVVNQANPRLNPNIAQLWIISGHYMEDPQVNKYINWTATAYSYGSKRNKKAAFKLDTLGRHDAASGFTPPVPGPVSQSPTKQGFSPAQSGGVPFRFTVDFKSLKAS